MRGQKIYLSSNGYEYLESYTKAIYGERGSFRHNLKRYLGGNEFAVPGRDPKSIDDIPEISFQDIKNQITREEYFKQLCNNVLSIYSQREKEGILNKEDYFEIAGIMGLCPGHCDWHETLFPHLVDLFVSSEEEGEQIRKSVEENANIVEVMVRAMLDGLFSGQVINYFGRNVWSQGYARNFYRGENAYNAQSRPSLFRGLPEDPEQAEICKVIRNMRIIEFSLWLNSLSFVKEWPFGDIYHGAIAQHYGIATNGLDITSDLKTALFFACCHFENEKWRPLRPDEYEAAASRNNIAKRGGDSKYGILFCAPADVANMSRMADLSDLRVTGVTPVGFQPFMRCSNQSGYIIEAGEPYDLYKDISFKKIKFRHTPQICEWIFKEMDEGKTIYPQEMFGTCEDIVETIRHQKNFSQKAFDATMEYMKLQKESERILLKLKERHISIVQKVIICDTERQAEIEKSYEEAFVHHEYSTMPVMIRPQFSI